MTNSRTVVEGPVTGSEADRMGISIYYAATRSYCLSEEEQQAVDAVADKYSIRSQIEEYDRAGVAWNGEDFCLYDPPLSSPETILEGATKLPDASEKAFWDAVQHWCRALSAIRRLLPDAEWHVHIDDLDITWDEERQEFDLSW
jgi:hypothetical protein